MGEAGWCPPGSTHARLTRHADLPDDMEDEVLGQQPGRHLAIQREAHRGRHLDQQLAGAQDEASIGVAHPGGKLAKGAGVAGVGVGAKQHLACKAG